jgi:act minimal PKS chain-length factor (CLF/KS beta)
MTSKSIVVTGLGAIAPSGIGQKEIWGAALSGDSAIAPIATFDASRYPSRLIGQLADFRPDDHFSSRIIAQTDRVTQFALLASDEAVTDADVTLSALDPERVGVVTSNATGGFEFTHREMAKLWTQGPDTVSVYQSFAWFYAVNTGQISIRHGVKGPSGVLCGEQAGGLDAIGHGARIIRRGADMALAGGFESSFDPWGWVSHCASGRVSTAQRPEDAYLPFDSRAAGYVPGEGGALLVLEDLARFRERSDATPYGRIAGQASTFDPPGPGPATGLERAIRAALVQAGREPAEVGFVVADAAGLPELDRGEADALAKVFGRHALPVTAPKSAVGRLMGGGGPLDAVYALMALRDNVIPPTAHTQDVPESYGLDLVVGTARPCVADAALVLARGVGGFNSALLIERL